MFRARSCFILLLLAWKPFELYAQNDYDYARDFVKSLGHPGTHGFWSDMIDYDSTGDVSKHIKEHSSIYIELIKKEIAWPDSDSLFWHDDSSYLYHIMLPVLELSRSSEAEEMLVAIYLDAASRHNGYVETFEKVAFTGVPPDSLDTLIDLQERIMGISLSGLKQFQNDLVLSDAMSRYDDVGFMAQVKFYRFIRDLAETNSSAREWLITGGIGNHLPAQKHDQ